MFKPYLSVTKQVVQVDGVSSNLEFVKNGVLHLGGGGPLLDICKWPPYDISSNVLSFTHDTTFINGHKVFDLLCSLSNGSLREARIWFNVNSLLINENKTHETFSEYGIKDKA